MHGSDDSASPGKRKSAGGGEQNTGHSDLCGQYVLQHLDGSAQPHMRRGGKSIFRSGSFSGAGASAPRTVLRVCGGKGQMRV